MSPFAVILACPCGKETGKIEPRVIAENTGMVLSYTLPEGWSFHPMPDNKQVAVCSIACLPKTESEHVA